MKPSLTISDLIEEARVFCAAASAMPHPLLFGVTDGKAVGTLIEQLFKTHLAEKYAVTLGNPASGIDLPDAAVLTDIKVTSIRQPQSSCPFKDAKQKIFGLGYNLLIFVYDKKDDPESKTATLDFVSCVFVEKERTGDYTTTLLLREMVARGANVEDIQGFLYDKKIPVEPDILELMAEQILQTPPEQGYLTISNALQWRLQYQRVVGMKESVEGIAKIVNKLVS